MGLDGQLSAVEIGVSTQLFSRNSLLQAKNPNCQPVADRVNKAIIKKEKVINELKFNKLRIKIITQNHGTVDKIQSKINDINKKLTSLMIKKEDLEKISQVNAEANISDNKKYNRSVNEIYLLENDVQYLTQAKNDLPFLYSEITKYEKEMVELNAIEKKNRNDFNTCEGSYLPH